MKTMKHFLCLVLTLILCFQSAVPVYAAEAEEQMEESAVMIEEETEPIADEKAAVSETELYTEVVGIETVIETDTEKTSAKTTAVDDEPPHFYPFVKIHPSGSDGVRIVFQVEDPSDIASLKYKVWKFGENEPSTFYLEENYEFPITLVSEYCGFELSASEYGGLTGPDYGPFYVAAYAYDKAGNVAMSYPKKPISLYKSKPGFWVTGTYKVASGISSVRTAPVESINGKDTTITRLLPGSPVSVLGSRNINGEEWYQTESGSWMKAEDLTRYSLFMMIRDFLENLFDKDILNLEYVIYTENDAIPSSVPFEESIDTVLDNGVDISASVCARPASEADVPISLATISFNPNGGTVGVGSISCLTGDEIGPMPTPYRFGYEFDGWFTAADGGDQIYEDSTCEGNMTLYAHWTRIILMEGECGDNLHFILYGDGILDITGSGEMNDHPWNYEYAERVLEVNLPDTLTAICDHAFEDCLYLEKITIPGRVKRIEEGTFKNCIYLDTVTIPSSITYVGDEAFQWCEYLKEVVLINVTEIGENAFEGCKSLAEADLGNKLTYIGHMAFCNTALTEIFISKTLDRCGYYAGASNDEGPFMGCANLKTVTFESGITTIPEGVFAGCTGLENIVIPGTVTKIEDCSFSFCPNLASVTFSQSLTEIGEGAFYANTSLSQVSIPDSVRRINTDAFAESSYLSKATLPKRLTFLGARAFANTALTEITIPKSLDYCGYFLGGSNDEGPFMGCANLKTVHFEDGIESIPEGVFAGCNGIQEVVIPDAVEILEDWCFAYCKNLSKVTLGSQVQEINDGVFSWNSSLKEITLPETVTRIGSECFSGSGIEKISIPAGVDGILWGTFSECTALTQVSLPEGGSLRYIENEAFYACSALTEIEIPLGVTDVDGYAFYECTALKRVVIPDSVTYLEDRIFYNCDSLTEVSLGKGITFIPESTFEDCDSLESILIPYRVTEIGPDAFKNDVSLTSITIPKSVTFIDESAFSYPQILTIYGVAGSYAEEFANENDIRFVAINVPAEQVILSETNLQLNVYDTAMLYLTITPENFTDDVVWESSDPNVVRIDENGQMRANRGGFAEITVTVGNVSASCTVQVYQPVYHISIWPYTVEMEEGETLQLEATIDPENATNKLVLWSSSDESIASVDENGLVTANAAGTAEITATPEDNADISDSCVITVKEAASEEQLVTSIVLNKESAELDAGETVQLTATVLPENATDKTIQWYSTNTSVASVSGNGLVTAKAPGRCMITATAADRGVISAVCAITVKETSIQATDIYFMSDSGEWAMGRSFALIAHITPENATDYTVTWTSSNPAIAEVNDGMVSVKAYGTATITATLKSGSLTKSASYTVKALFNDVMDNSQYYYKPVYWAADKGITTGYSDGSFGVGRDCQRRELLIFMWRFAGSPTKDKKGVAYGDARKMFNDMNAYGTSSAANKSVAWAYKEGIVKGYSDGGIHPTASIVRKDVMIMLYRLAGKPAVSGTLTFPDCKSFKKTSDTYKAILWGSKNKITNGYSSGPYAGQFGVNLNCLREQIVTFLYRYNNIK